MLPDIPYKKRRKINLEDIDKRFSFWFITIWIIIGILMIIAVVFSVASCKEQRKLEEERAALQKSRDSLEARLIIMPVAPSSPMPLIEDADKMENFQPLSFKCQQPVVEIYK